MNSLETPRDVDQWISQGIALAKQHRFHEAKTCFVRSLDVRPTAEGYTFLGWMLAQEGFLETAIELCQTAISLDPDFGNPYNDIGSYLMHLDRLDEAIPWLEQAKQAKRYEPRQFPFLNLGRLYLRQGNLEKARQEYEDLLAIDPDHHEAKNVLKRIQKMIKAAHRPHHLHLTVH